MIINNRYDNHREHLHRYVVRRRADLLETVIPFFQEHPLRSSKREDFGKYDVSSSSPAIHTERRPVSSKSLRSRKR